MNAKTEGGTKVWVYSASESGQRRDFEQVCFDFGVAALGGTEQKKYAKNVKKDNYLVMKKSDGKGKFSISAIGKVKSGFESSGFFDDVDG